MTINSHTSQTHRSRIARRLDRETGMGYQKALNTVRDHADDLLVRLGIERLDAAGCDMMLRALMQQNIEFWGPGIGAHSWPGVYPSLYVMLPIPPPSPEALDAAEYALRSDNPAEPCGMFDPAWLAESGVEPVLGDALDNDDYDDEVDFDSGNERDFAVEHSVPVDEPDRWKSFVLGDGPRQSFRLPDSQSLSAEIRAELDQLDRNAVQARLGKVIEDDPAAVEAYVRRADLALDAYRRVKDAGGTRDSAALAQAWAGYECAVAAGEAALPMVHIGTLPWSQPANRAFLQSLYGLASVAYEQGRWNLSERVLLTLLFLNPHDQQNASGLLRTVRHTVGLPAPER